MPSVCERDATTTELALRVTVIMLQQNAVVVVAVFAASHFDRHVSKLVAVKLISRTMAAA